MENKIKKAKMIAPRNRYLFCSLLSLFFTALSNCLTSFLFYKRRAQRFFFIARLSLPTSSEQSPR